MFAKLVAFVSGLATVAKMFVVNFIAAHIRVIANFSAAVHAYVTEVITHIHNVVAGVMIHLHALLGLTPTAAPATPDAQNPPALTV
jgi:phage-related protein